MCLVTFETFFFFFWLKPSPWVHLSQSFTSTSSLSFPLYLPTWYFSWPPQLGSVWINASLMDSLEVVTSQGTAEDLTLYNSPPGKVKPNRQRDQSIYTNIGASHAK